MTLSTLLSQQTALWNKIHQETKLMPDTDRVFFAKELHKISEANKAIMDRVRERLEADQWAELKASEIL